MKFGDFSFRLVLAALMLMAQLCAPTAHAHLSNSPTSHKEFQTHDHFAQSVALDNEMHTDHDSGHDSSDIHFMSHDATPITKTFDNAKIKKMSWEPIALARANLLQHVVASRAPPQFYERPSSLPDSVPSSGFYALAPPSV